MAFHPGQLAAHRVQLMAQRADQLQGLGGIGIPHDEMVASHWPSRRQTFDSHEAAAKQFLVL
jgi:conjugal transfer/entry exclusion protein